MTYRITNMLVGLLLLMAICLGGEIGIETGLVAYFKYDGHKLLLSKVYCGNRSRAKMLEASFNNDATPSFLEFIQKEAKDNQSFSGLLVLEKRGPIPKQDDKFLAEAFSFLERGHIARENEKEMKGGYFLSVSSRISCYNDVSVISFEKNHAWKLLPEAQMIPIPKDYPR